MIRWLGILCAVLWVSVALANTQQFTTAATTDEENCESVLNSSSYPPAFLDCFNGSADINPSKNKGATNYYVASVMNRWDTSSLTAGVTISSATYEICIIQNSVVNDDSRSFSCEWYANWGTPGASDYTTGDTAGTALTVALSSLTAGTAPCTVNILTLTNPDANIAKTGTTALRCAITGGAPGTGTQNLFTYDGSTLPSRGPKLNVVFTAAGADTATPTETATITPTATQTSTATETHTPVATTTVTPTGTETATGTETPTGTETATAAPTGTETQTPTVTETATITPTGTDTPTGTETATSTVTPTATETPTATTTGTQTPTGSHTLTATPTVTNTPHSICATPLHCKTFTPTITPTPSPAPTAVCPYNFGTDTGALGKTCFFTTHCHPGNGCGYTNASCLAAMAPMDSYFSGDGNKVTITLSTQPAVIWSGRVGFLPTIANLQGYQIGTGPFVVFPAVGTITNSTGAHPDLTITPNGGLSPYNICAFPQGCTWDQSCPFHDYVGNFVQIISGLAPPPSNFLMPVPHESP